MDLGQKNMCCFFFSPPVTKKLLGVRPSKFDIRLWILIVFICAKFFLNIWLIQLRWPRSIIVLRKLSLSTSERFQPCSLGSVLCVYRIFSRRFTEQRGSWCVVVQILNISIVNWIFWHLVFVWFTLPTVTPAHVMTPLHQQRAPPPKVSMSLGNLLAMITSPVKISYRIIPTWFTFSTLFCLCSRICRPWTPVNLESKNSERVVCTQTVCLVNVRQIRR